MTPPITPHIDLYPKSAGNFWESCSTHNGQTTKRYSIALQRCKSGIAVYKTVLEEGGVRWQVFSAHLFNQYYKRFLQDKFDEPLHKKEIIQEFMLYNILKLLAFTISSCKYLVFFIYLYLNNQPVDISALLG